MLIFRNANNNLILLDVLCCLKNIIQLLCEVTKGRTNIHFAKAIFSVLDPFSCGG